jgi:hypothetical protein
MCQGAAQSVFEKKDRIDREIPQVREVIECIEDHMELTEAVSSPV